MNLRGVVGAAFAAVVAVMVAGCAAALPASEFAQPGVRVQGSVLLHKDAGDNCWHVSYVDGGTEVAAPLALPAGYEARDIAMFDPGTGKDVPGPALISADGEVVGFVNGTVIFAGEYRALDDAALADARERCAWTSPPLVPDEGTGISTDPDGLTEVVYLCRSGNDGTGPDENPAMHLDECDKSTREPLVNASTVPGDG